MTYKFFKNLSFSDYEHCQDTDKSIIRINVDKNIEYPSDYTYLLTDPGNENFNISNLETILELIDKNIKKKQIVIICNSAKNLSPVVILAYMVIYKKKRMSEILYELIKINKYIVPFPKHLYNICLLAKKNKQYLEDECEKVYKKLYGKKDPIVSIINYMYIEILERLPMNYELLYYRLTIGDQTNYHKAVKGLIKALEIYLLF